MPAACPSCDDDQLRYVAFVPARVVYEGKRAEKARSSTELHENGFHGYRADCRDCGTVAEQTDGVPLCGTAGPLRSARLAFWCGGPLCLWWSSASSIECDFPRSASCFASSTSLP